MKAEQNTTAPVKIYVRYIYVTQYDQIRAKIYYGPYSFLRYLFNASTDISTQWFHASNKEDLEDLKSSVKSHCADIYRQDRIKIDSKNNILKRAGLKQGSIKIFGSKIDALTNSYKPNDIIL